MSKYLVFDATSVRKITNYKAEHHDINSWPELVHLSWIGLNEECKPVEDHNFIIKIK